jgi:CubicO group peptidase (beta-lactamase class C family)
VVSSVALALSVVLQLGNLDSVAFNKHFSGVIVVARTDGRVVFSRAFGMADRQAYTPIKVGTKFITGSVAQTFTAAAVVSLVKAGKIAYDAPLSRYLPDSVYPKDRADHMTIRQLLTHTAGLGPGVVELNDFRAAPQSFTTFDQILGLLRSQPLAGDTGKYAYTGADCDLLGAVVERVSGQPFADYLRDHVFTPAGMTASGFNFSHRPVDLAHGYTARGGPLHPNDAMLPRIGLPEAVAYTTALDLVHFAHWLTLPAFIADTVPTGQEGPNRLYGYGFFVGMNGSTRIVNHGGTGPGIDNAFDIYPDARYVVAIMSNQDPPAAQDIRQYLRLQIAK